MATTRVEMQPLLENESEVQRQQESTNNNRGAGSGGTRVDIAPLDSMSTYANVVTVFFETVFSMYYLCRAMHMLHY